MGRRCSVILLGGTTSPEMGVKLPERVAPPYLGVTLLPFSQEHFPTLRLPLQVTDPASAPHLATPPSGGDPALSCSWDSQTPLSSRGLAREAPRALVPSRVMLGGESCLLPHRSTPGKSAAHWEVGAESLSHSDWPRPSQSREWDLGGEQGPQE